MKKPKNTFEIFRLLEKSNCRECGLPTCLVFALAVFKGEKTLGDCPRIDPDTAGRFGPKSIPDTRPDPDAEEGSMTLLKEQIKKVDLSAAADRTGGRFARGKLTIKVLGKDFSVGSDGTLSSDIHINEWVGKPVLTYVLKTRGLPPSGKWVPLRELESGKDWDSFFTHRCENPLKKVADTYPDLFSDLVHIFNGKAVSNHYQADVSLVLHPLPKVPLLVCYWKAEEGLPSTLNLFFDTTAEKNLPIESIYSLGAGLAVMFGKLALRHGY